MKTMSVLALALMPVGLCGPALAQDASQWAGAYAGLTYSTGDAFQTYDTVVSYDLEGDGAGLILGYNLTSGPWVYGAELAYSRPKIAELPPSTDYTFTSFLDLKARGGYAVENVLFYGVLGGTFSQWEEGAGSPSFDGDGLLYGIGVDYKITPAVFIGADYIRRDVTSDWTTLGNTFEADPTTLTVRVGMSF
jgi:outer membrane immunogenic protein